MASGRFTAVPARPTAFLDFRSVTLGESAEFPTRVKEVMAMAIAYTNFPEQKLAMAAVLLYT